MKIGAVRSGSLRVYFELVLRREPGIAFIAPLAPRIRSPSQWPGSRRPSMSSGLSLMLVVDQRAPSCAARQGMDRG